MEPISVDGGEPRLAVAQARPQHIWLKMSFRSQISLFASFTAFAKFPPNKRPSFGFIEAHPNTLLPICQRL
ncbi:hypothetical protein SAY86_030359 [Trapa natans]|uniref:Uncharacterized protein n=1 Tax=Trapa natans TaxID=22666 RepID=A0AAN7RIC7_TRANT|nr:hypothetical protein SAY86_030359 [Trapa natans]